MTKSEGDRIDELTKVVYQMLGRVDSVLETVPQLMTKEMCEERHGNNAGKINQLTEDGLQTMRFTDRLRGMAIPMAICIAAISLILTFVR